MAVRHQRVNDRLKPQIRSKRQGQLSKDVVLLHDNARPHTAAHAVETLQKLKFEVLAHPSYSPDLSPSDYHLFGPPKEALRGRDSPRTKNWKKRCIRGPLLTQNVFFPKGIKKLVQRWKKCIEKKGDYVEKLCYYQCSTFIEINFCICIADNCWLIYVLRPGNFWSNYMFFTNYSLNSLLQLIN